MRGFNVCSYSVDSTKIKSQKSPIRIFLLSDLHGAAYPENYKELYGVIRQKRPDLILICGDMLTGKKTKRMDQVLHFICRIRDIAPVYYAYGNHEQKLEKSEGKLQEEFRNYCRVLKEHKIVFLNNETAHLKVEDQKIAITGLFLGPQYFHKPIASKLTLKDITALVGTSSVDPEEYQILLAHNPKYGDCYFEWKPDLILSGHFHGGVVRFGENRGLVAPQLPLIPPYCCGIFKKRKQCMVVSAGLGEHTIPIRIHNPRELIELCVYNSQREALQKSQ